MTANKQKKITKIDRVKMRLLAGEVLTVRDIIAMGVNRPTDIVWLLRKRGLEIISTNCTDPVTGEQFVKYSIA